MFRECGECTACCTWLVGESYGIFFGNGKSCKFLKCDGCSIYEERPKVCRKYQCAWSQEILPFDMRPDKCNFIVSVEERDGNNCLKVIATNKKDIKIEYKNILLDISKKMNCEIVFCTP